MLPSNILVTGERPPDIKRTNRHFDFNRRRYLEGEEYEDTDFIFYLDSSKYNYDKLYNSLDHLFTLIAQNPELWINNSREMDPDPFAPGNYKGRRGPITD